MTFKILAAAVGVSLMTATVASAASFTQTQIMTQGVQDFTFDFLALPSSDGTGGTLTVASGGFLGTGSLARPGIDLNKSDEFFSLAIEGTSFGDFSCNAIAGQTELNAANTNDADCVFSVPIALSGVDLDGFLADGGLSAFFDFSDEVTDFGDQDELVVTLSYETDLAAVPLPAGGLLLLTGLGGIAAFKRRKKRAA